VFFIVSEICQKKLRRLSGLFAPLDYKVGVAAAKKAYSILIKPEWKSKAPSEFSSKSGVFCLCPRTARQKSIRFISQTPAQQKEF